LALLLLTGEKGVVGSDISETIIFTCFYSVIADVWDHELLIAQSFPLFILEDSYS
jgi:hypothetical protein